MLSYGGSFFGTAAKTKELREAVSYMQAYCMFSCSVSAAVQKTQLFELQVPKKERQLKLGWSESKNLPWLWSWSFGETWKEFVTLHNVFKQSVTFCQMLTIHHSRLFSVIGEQLELLWNQYHAAVYLVCLAWRGLQNLFTWDVNYTSNRSRFRPRASSVFLYTTYWKSHGVFNWPLTHKACVGHILLLTWTLTRTVSCKQGWWCTAANKTKQNKAKISTWEPALWEKK